MVSISLKLSLCRVYTRCTIFRGRQQIGTTIDRTAQKRKVKIKTLSERFCALNRSIPRKYFEYLADDDAQRKAVLRHVHGERA